MKLSIFSKKSGKSCPAFSCRARHLIVGFVMMSQIFTGLHSVCAESDSAARSSEEVLAADDVLAITVLDHPEFSVDQVTVGSDGKIQLPLIGSISVAKKTLRQVTESVRKALLKELRDPQPTVTLKLGHPRRVFVLGAVVKPGIYEIKPGWRITEVIAAAGGLAVRSELAEVSFTRGQQSPKPLDLARILASGSDPSNVVLKEDDVVRISSRTVQVSVAGQVKTPGSFDVPIGNGVIEAIAIAGGPTERAAKTQITVKHLDGTVVAVDLTKLMAPGNAALNFALKAGDLVVLPESLAHVTVRGAVVKPGYVDIPDGEVLHVTEAIALAGGATPPAALSKASVTHLDGTVVPVDLFKALVRGEAGQNPPLQDGDLVVLPESRAHVTIHGPVAKQGYVDIPDGEVLHATEAIALAGGVMPGAALSKATLTHADGTVVPIDLYKALVLGDKGSNLLLNADETIDIPKSEGITVLGNVAKAGTYNVESGTALLSEVLALAGGLNIRPEAARINISRKLATGKQIILNPSAISLVNARDTSQNAVVMDGDLITVTAQESKMVTISGQVKTPGVYELTEGDSVPELIARAGGAMPAAALSRVVVTPRGGTSQTVDAFAAIQNGQKLDFPIHEGDIVVVPENKRTIVMLGAVNKAGAILVPENETLTLATALGLAGGTQPNAGVKEIGIFRKDPTSPTGRALQPQIVSLQQGKGGLNALNMPLEEGSVVYVPEGKVKSTVWSKIGSVASAVLALTRL